MSNLIIFDLVFSLYGVESIKVLLGKGIVGIDYIVHLLVLLVFALYNRNPKIPKKYLTLLTIYILLLPLLFIFSRYSKSTLFFLIGCFVMTLPILTSLVFYSLSINKRFVHSLLKKTCSVLFFISVVILLGLLLRPDDLGLIVGKDLGITIGVISFNCPISLYMYYKTRKKKYLFICVFSFSLIALSALLKSIAISALTIVLMVTTNSKHKVKIGAILIISIVAAVLVLPSISDKAQQYLTWYVLSPERGKIGRNALYIAAFAIARDGFPFGSGPGTFGSFPVNIAYNQVYYDYNLSKIFGLGPGAILPGSKANFLLDTFWPSIIGELGFVGAIIYIAMLFFPAINKRKEYPKGNMEYALVKAIMYSFIIHGAFLNVGMQVAFIIIYAGIAVFIIKTKSNTGITDIVCKNKNMVVL